MDEKEDFGGALRRQHLIGIHLRHVACAEVPSKNPEGPRKSPDYPFKIE